MASLEAPSATGSGTLFGDRFAFYAVYGMKPTMQIVIPMSGFGERFRRAGYTVPKPLIEIDGKPMIAHVVDLFPGEREVIFVCNREHLDDPAFGMEAILRGLRPSGRIVAIAPHKLGPAHAVRQAEGLLDPERPVAVNYCDFSCYWDWRRFKRFVAETGCDGAIPAYRGFHPHSLGSTNYAYLREIGGWVSDIREKKPFTQDRMTEYASSGTYYFASARSMIGALKTALERDLSVGGEYYMSLVYKPLIEEGKRIAVYPLQHFMQWGTPEDVSEYLGWSAAFRRLAEAPSPPPARGSCVVSLAGLGRRFAEAGRDTPKPAIPVSGRPMAVQAARALPPVEHRVFVLRRDMPGANALAGEMERAFPGAVIETVPGVTEGQACTALAGLDALERGLGRAAPGPVTFGACDHAALYDATAFRRAMADDSADAVVWTVRGHADAIRRPEMFGWVGSRDGRVVSVSVKQPLGSPATDEMIAGAFTFRRAADFRRCAARLFARGGRVNGEFYIDSCLDDALALGLDCRSLEVENYLSWGTPDDLGVFEYWQSCFHKWPGHPYCLEHDRWIPPSELAGIVHRYRETAPDAARWVRISGSGERR